MEDENNIIILSRIEESKEQIFELAKIYKNFSENLDNTKKDKNKDEYKAYIISREYIDNFKEIIKYEETKEYLKESENENNLKLFKEKLKDKTLEELDSILCANIKLYCNLSEIQEDLSKGFDFINYYFLDKLDFDENFDDYIVPLYKKGNNILVEFDDKSKLIIEDENGTRKYHVIDPPIIKVDNMPEIKRTKTSAYFSNRRSKTRKIDFIKRKFKTIHNDEINID